MYIRSQNKRLLFNVTRIGLSPNDNDKPNVFYIIVDGAVFGAYDTEKQAMEIMDEIQNNLVRGTTMYEMPLNRPYEKGEPEVIIDETSQS